MLKLYKIHTMKLHKSYHEFYQKKKMAKKILTPLPKSHLDGPHFKGSSDTTIALSNDKVNVELQDLDEQIKSMITRSDLSAGPGKGKMASCNVCGKEGPFHDMPKHVEATHITGVSHACGICGKIASSRPALKTHIFTKHKSKGHQTM